VIFAAYFWRADLAFELGYAYEVGNFHGWTPGFSHDDGRAAWWLMRAAEADHPRAQYLLGLLIAHGAGVAADDARAEYWFGRAANQAYAPACFHLAWMYHKGDGVIRDKQRAHALMEQAAILGMVKARLALGHFAEQGDSEIKSYPQAWMWYELAAEAGQRHPNRFDNASIVAKARVDRERIAGDMSGPELNLAKRLADQWRTATHDPE
jgi:hypothetical protein